VKYILDNINDIVLEAIREVTNM